MKDLGATDTSTGLIFIPHPKQWHLCHLSLMEKHKCNPQSPLPKRDFAWVFRAKAGENQVTSLSLNVCMCVLVFKGVHVHMCLCVLWPVFVVPCLPSFPSLQLPFPGRASPESRAKAVSLAGQLAPSFLSLPLCNNGRLSVSPSQLFTWVLGDQKQTLYLLGCPSRECGLSLVKAKLRLRVREVDIHTHTVRQRP